MFERFTENARTSVIIAQTTAIELRAGRTEPEHLLLGLLHTAGVAQRVLTGAGADLDTLTSAVAGRRASSSDEESLRSLGIDLGEVRRRVEDTFGPGAMDQPAPRRRGVLGKLLPSTHLPFTPAAKKVLENSLRVALELRHNYIGTEHILLAALRDERAAAALRAAGVELGVDSARAQVLDELHRSA